MLGFAATASFTHKLTNVKWCVRRIKSITALGWSWSSTEQAATAVPKSHKMTPGWLKMVSRWSKMALKLLQVGSRQAHLGLREAQDGSQKAIQFLKNEGSFPFCKNMQKPRKSNKNL